MAARSTMDASFYQKDGKSLYLGTYTDETDAARAYDAAARQKFGEFARCNFPADGTA